MKFTFYMKRGYKIEIVVYPQEEKTNEQVKREMKDFNKKVAEGMENLHTIIECNNMCVRLCDVSAFIITEEIGG